MEKVINVIAQTSSDCNIYCGYCYVRASRNGLKIFMPIDGLSGLIRNCSYGFDEVRFCWHGGEPLLRGIKFYQQVVSTQKLLSKESGVKFQNSIQTNGLLIDDDWIKFFNDECFSVGVSFDAPPDVNNRHRILGQRGIPRDYLFRAVDCLNRYGFPLNILCVVSELNVNRGEEIFNFFSSIGVNSYSLLLMMKTSLAGCPNPPSNEELFNLYKTTFDLWLGRNHEFESIDPIDTIVKALLGSEMIKLCSFGAHCLKRMITVAPNGDIIPCGSFIADKFVLGNALKEPLLKALASDKCKSFREQREVC